MADSRSRKPRLCLFAFLAISWHAAFLLPLRQSDVRCRPGHSAMKASWLEMLEEAVGAPTPQPANPTIPTSVKPLSAELMTRKLTAFVLEEKGLAMSGEDFDVKTPEGELVVRIGGGNRVPIPGMPVWDKLTVSTANGQQVGTLERQAFAMTASYDILRPNGKKFGRISKAMFALTSTFELYQEDDSEGGALLRAEGSFSDKSYVMKSRQGQVVATVTRLKGFTGGNIDNYQVIVGENVDASLVLSMAVVIDEIHDEENPQEAGAETLPDMLEDAQGLPMPKAASPMIPTGTPPLDPELVHATATAYELEEKGLSMSGEDFEVKSPLGQVLLRISGGNRLPLAGMPVWDKLTISTGSGGVVASLDREMVAMTPTYDVMRPDGSRFGKIAKAMFGFTETFEFFLEGDAGGPVLKAEGSFSERFFQFKSREGTVVATVGRGYYQTDNENRYHVVVGPQVDATLVVAMAFAIDEVHDEENAGDKPETEEGGWPFR
ncbi:unnamed protein product [Symbiodinium natans]|uniref:Phospholipid scramblase n=1 Tax=Symbiodinium natans TaxID=878477 RepID=A0A812H5C8_9DINO|nr:unnamed protein product [Symbiodinium natans]